MQSIKSTHEGKECTGLGEHLDSLAVGISQRSICRTPPSHRAGDASECNSLTSAAS